MNYFKKILINYARPSNLKKQDGLEYWRERISLIIIFWLTLLGIIALIPGLVLSIKVKLWDVAIIDLAIYLIVLVLFIKKNLGYRFKAIIIIVVSYFLGLYLVLTVGPSSAGYIWMFMAPVFTSIFFDKRIAHTAILINIITLVVVGVLIQYKLLPAWNDSDLQTEVWMVISTSFLILNYGMVFPILQIINGIESTLRKEKSVNRTLSHQKKLLITSKEEAIRANELKSEFLAQMSHEIRTPINTILSFISLLKEDIKCNDQAFEESFKMIENGSNRLIRTIDMILNMSELQAGSYVANYKEIDLVEEVLLPLKNEFKQLAKDKSLEFKFNNKLKVNDKILADIYSITQLFSNLIDNAIKYTNKGEISLNCFRQNGNIAVQIKDTGIGMSEEFQKKVFEPFAQEESGYTRKFDGNGLGLALVKQFCSINNAEIHIKSEKGIGSIFTVQLPVKK